MVEKVRVPQESQEALKASSALRERPHHTGSPCPRDPSLQKQGSRAPGKGWDLVKVTEQVG